MSALDEDTDDMSQPADSPLAPEIKSRQLSRFAKEKKKRTKTRSRVIKDDEDTASNDPDYSPCEETEGGSGDASSCSTPIEEKLSSHSSTPVSDLYPCSGAICALCYCGEKSLLGQGDLTRYDPTPNFNAFRKPTLKRGNRDSYSGPSPGSDMGDRSSKSPSRSRSRETRHSQDAASRNVESQNISVVDELSNLGCAEIADPANVFEASGHVTAHHCCAAWSEGVTQNELYQLLCVDKAVHQGLSLKCSYCNRFGATIKCKATRCDKFYHYPCAAGSGCFQDIKSMLMLCPDHLEQAPSIGAPEELNCAVCDDMGEISDFLFCTSCGHHYHGNCLHPFVSVNPVVRAGWQCPDCKICQTCRQPGDDNKMLVCDACDKGYHTYCLQPAMPFIPKNGWCCQSCRRCSDCGSKSASNGSSSQWRFSEEVCDNCYEQRNKGSGCPVCGKPCPEKLPREDMMQCNDCKKWVHEECEDVIDMDTYYDMGSDYSCPKCRNEAEVEADATTDVVAGDVVVPEEEQLSLPSATSDETKVKSEEVLIQKFPAKRSSASSSLESDKSSSAMKGSSTDPMLFASHAPSLKISTSKHRHVSDETIAAVSEHVRSLIERKTSSESHHGSIFGEDSPDPLSLFSGDSFQPIVSVPMLCEEEQGDAKDGAEWSKRKIPRLSEQRSLTKSSKLAEEPSRPGAGKPGGMFGKGKPFKAKKKPTGKGSKGKNQSKGKSSRSGRRQRQESMGSAASASLSNAPSPVGASGNSQTSSSSLASSAIGVRRRTRNRLNRQESMLGTLSAVAMSREGIDEEYGDSMHNTVVLCSADDAFTLNQDMCVVCGSFGQGAEGRLVSCSQCGQCYHPYCVNLKLTKVVLRKGWRCLDCTVCEECGAADDPSHLLLCDDCDISYHTYCLKPPLQHVPKGGWKCKWCVKCNHCGSLTPGFNCDWAENYTSCGPCASLSHCPLCRRSYRDEETIMQCSTCERWLHSTCEYLYTESDIEKVLEKGYSCLFCRPKGSTPPHLDLNPPQTFEGDPSSGIYLGRTRSDAEQVKEYHKDGVALTSAGLQHIQQLMQHAMGLHKKKPNVPKRKSSVQKQADKVSTPVEMKPVAQVESATAKEPAPPLSKSEDDALSVDSQSGPLLAAKIEPGSGGMAVGSVLGSQVVDDMQTSMDGIDVGMTLPEQLSSDQTKQVLGGVQQGGIKRRRKPYRPGIGGFMVRQRGRGGIVNPRNRRSRTQPSGSNVPGVNLSGAAGFDTAPPKGADVKLRASEIAGECESSYIKHEMEGGITIAHKEQDATMAAEVKSEVMHEEKSEGQTSMLVSPLKLKISTVPPVHPKAKRKRRSRLIDQFPPYIQDGFFGPQVLMYARTASSKAIDTFEEDEANKTSIPSGSGSLIILPEKMKQRLDAQVAMKAAEAQKKAELKQERLHARRLPSGDDEGLMMDKESEDFLGVLPDDLPFKDDELLGILSGSQGQGGQDTHESILSPSALETLVSDGLASIGVDYTSLFSDVLNHGHDGTTSNDEHGLLGDIGNLTSDPPKSTPSSNTGSTPTTQDTSQRDSTSSAAFDIDPTDAIIDHITAEHNQAEEKMLIEQKQTQMQRQAQQQQQQQQRQLQQQQIHMQQHQPNFPPQSPMLASNVPMTARHMFPDSANMPNVSPQQQQHSQVQVPMQQGHGQPGSMPFQQQNKNLQPHFIAVANQGNTGMPQNVTPGMPQNVTPGMPIAAQTPDHLQSPAMLARQHSLDVNMQTPGQMDIQTPQQRAMTPSASMVPMFGSYPGSNPQMSSRPGSGMSNPSISHSPALVCKMENNGSPMKQGGQVVAVSNLPDLTSDTNIFEPAPPPWPLGTDLEGDTLSVNQRNILKWEKDEPLGELATISPVLYANMKHAYLKKDFPDWPTRAKQVAKLWRKATPEERAPFLQKARDNRSFLKSSRRDVAEVNEQDLLSMEFMDQEEDVKPGIQHKAPIPQAHELQPGAVVAGQAMHPDGRVIPSNVGLDNLKIQQIKFQMQQHAHQVQMQQQTMAKPPLQSSSPLNPQDYNNFAKPRPLSRDPTPKPQSPGVATSPMMPGTRSKSPFPAEISTTSPIAGTQRPRAPWGDANFIKQSMEMQQQQLQMQGNGQQQMMGGVGQHTWHAQQGQLRMPKMEAMESSGMMTQQAMRFPQPFQGSHPSQNFNPGGTPMSMSPSVRPILQRSRSGHDIPMARGQEQFILRPVNPRPGMAPQLLQMNQRPVTPGPVSPHAGSRTPGHKGSQPSTPQPSLPSRESFMEAEKPPQPRMSSSDAQQAITPVAVGNQALQSPLFPQSPVPGTPKLAGTSEGEGIKTEVPDIASTAPSSGIMQGTVGRPQIREVLHRHTTQRRYKLLEQQTLPGGSWAAATTTVITRPPPPYPSQSPVASQGAFVYPPNIRPEQFSATQNQAMQMNESRIRAGFRPPSVPASPSLSSNLTSPLLTPPSNPPPSFGIERYPSITNASSGVTGVHPISGQSPVTGGYIELRHSKQPDPAVRREQIIRAGAALAATTPASPQTSAQSAATSKVGDGKTTSSTTPTTPLLTPKAEAVTSDASSATNSSAAEKVDAKLLSIKTEPVDSHAPPPDTALKISSPISTSSTDTQSAVLADTTLSTENKEKDCSNNQSDTSKNASNKDGTESKVTSPKEAAPAVGSAASATAAMSSSTQLDSQSDETTNVNTEAAIPISDSSAVSGVSEEHSYVKASPVKRVGGGSPVDAQGQKESKSESVVAPSQEIGEARKSLSPTDGLIHGVGMTPPDHSVSHGISSLEDDQDVCIEVTVGKDGEAVKKAATSPKDKSITEKILTSETTPEHVDEEGVSVSKTQSNVMQDVEISSSEKPLLKDEEIHIDLSKEKGETSPKTVVPESNSKPDQISVATVKVPISQSSSGGSASVHVDQSDVKEKESFSKTVVDGTTEGNLSSEAVVTVTSAAPLAVHETCSTASLTSVTSTTATEASVASSAAPGTPSSSVSTVQSATTTVVDAAQPAATEETSTATAATEVVKLSGSHPDLTQSSASQKLAAEKPVSGAAQSDAVPASVASVLPATAVVPGTQPTYPASQVAAQLPQPSKPKKPLLIKEQPLLLQDLLDEEKKEQERAKREKMTQAMMQQQGVVYSLPALPGMEAEKAEVGMDRILQAKMKVLSGIGQVITGTATTQPGPDGASQPGQMVQHPAGPSTWHHPPSGPHPIHGQGADSEVQRKSAQYEEWLFQHQALLQMQVKALEQASKQHRSTKLALTRKQRQSKKSGEEFTQMDAQTLTMVNRQQIDTQQQLEEVRKEQLRHSELVHTYNLTHGNMQFVSPIAGNTRPMAVVPQQPSQPGDMAHMVQPPFPQQHTAVRPQSVAGLPPNSQPSNQVRMAPPPSPNQTVSSAITAGAPVPTTAISAAQPAFTTPSTAASASYVTPPVGASVPQQSQEALMAQLQKIPGFRQMNPAQIQQLIIQHGGAVSTSSVHPSPAPQSHMQTASPLPKQLGLPDPGVTGTVPGHLSTQVVMPMGLRPAAPGQIAPLHGHMMSTQVASVNVNAGGNMATTQGTMIRAGSQPGVVLTSGNPIDPSAFMQMQHIPGTEGQHQIVQPEKKTKRRRKRKKDTTTAENVVVDPHFMMTQGVLNENQTMHMSSANIQPRMATPTTMFMTQPFGTLPMTSGVHVRPMVPPQPTAVTCTHESLLRQHATAMYPVNQTSSSLPMQQSMPPSTQPVATPSSLAMYGSLAPSRSSIASAPVAAPSPVISSLPMQSPAAASVNTATASTIAHPHMSQVSVAATAGVAPAIVTAPLPRNIVPSCQALPTVMQTTTPLPGPSSTPDVQQVASGMAGNASRLLVAQQPIPVSSIKKEIDSPQARLLKAELSAHFPSIPSSTPPRLASFTETELEIIMATDPDSRSTATTPDSASRTAPSPLSGRPASVTPSTPDDTSKRHKRDFPMDERSLSLIDDTIANVIKDSIDYEERLEVAKETGVIAVPPVWMRDPKPTKFPPKPPTPLSQMHQKQPYFLGAFGQPMFPHPLNPNNQELLRCMLNNGGVPTSMPVSSPAGFNTMSEFEKKEFDASPDHIKRQMELMGNQYNYSKMEEGNKKKRSRQSSKDKDGKEKPKKRKKKKHHRQEEGGFSQDPSHLPTELMGMHMHRGFGEEQGAKALAQWKPLPLLPLVEPDIKVNYSMCMPKGTGLAQSKSLLEGTLGSATLRGLPDYYDMLTCNDPFVYLNPPTPPSSLPPSPKRERLNSLDEVKGEPASYDQNVKVPDSLPTPPHQGPESADDIAAAGLLSDDAVPPSSPEAEDEKDEFSLNKFPLIRTAAHKEDLPLSFQVPSPVIPVISCPVKEEADASDEVSVTLSFKDSTTTKAIKKSLSQLSRALEASIISFKMEEPGKDAKKDGGNAAKIKVDGDGDTSMSNQRRCCFCDQWVVGNGVRKPLFGDHLQEEDIIFCNKQCYFANEFGKVQSAPVSKKKWKASQFYQRRTVKIDIASLIAENPDPEYITTRGRMGSVASGADATDDGQLKSADGKGRGRARRRGSTGPGEEGKAAAKRWKGIKWKRWSVGVTVVKSTNHKSVDVDALLSKYGSALKPPSDVQDTRICVLCGLSGDGDTKGVARLLNLDVDQWVHLNCALWSGEVYETQGGALINVDLAVRNGTTAMCNFCQKKGATVHCNRTRCTNVYHCACALQCGCHFYKDKTVLCPTHSMPVGGQAGAPQHHDHLRSLAVFRKVYVQRKETKQIASIMQQGELTQGEKNYILRVGALMFHAVGQLATQQMPLFHSKTAIYPVGYKATRIYWSSNNTRKRCKYMCMITEKDGSPWFTTRYQAVAPRPKNPDKKIQGEWMEMGGTAVNEQWSELLQQLANQRSQQKMLKLFPAYINGENVFGLTSPVVCRILESLPNIELCANYKFRYGRSPLLELPLAVNPTGCARSEAHIKHSRKKFGIIADVVTALCQLYRSRQNKVIISSDFVEGKLNAQAEGRPHTLISNLISEYYESTGIGDASSSLYGKHFVHSKSSQYRRMKQEWRNNVNLARSRIQGLGLFASRDIEPGTMVIEYIGEIIRSEVADKREKKYEAANRGVYMFRLDSDYIVDATVTGGPARYINHSCNPNCVAEVVNFEKEKKIMIISNRLILSGEELNYDYKFDFEDDGNKIPCLCGSINCRKWMN